MYSVVGILLLSPIVAADLLCYKGITTSTNEQPDPTIPPSSCRKYCMYRRCSVDDDCSNFVGTYLCGDNSCSKSTINTWNTAGGFYCCQSSLCTPFGTQPYYDIIGPPGNIGNTGIQPYYDVIGPPGNIGNPGIQSDDNGLYNAYADNNLVNQGSFNDPSINWNNSRAQYRYWISNALTLIFVNILF